MKSIPTILVTISGLAMSANAEIISYADFNLGEQSLEAPPLGDQGAPIPPVDSSGNNRDFVREANIDQIMIGTEGEIVAPASTAFLQLGDTGYFGGQFAALEIDNFAVGIYARASENLVAAGAPAHVFQSGNRSQSSVRISLTSEGWGASYEPFESAETPPLPEGVPFVTIGTPGTFTPDEWVHLAVIRTNGATSFYIDGIAQGDPETTITPLHGDNAHLGINPGGAVNFQGDIDALRALTFTPEDETVESIIAALQGIDSDADGLFDDFEQRIIAADSDDTITTLADVSPGGDFDLDGFANLAEQNAGSDPTDLDDPQLPLSTELELIAYWDFNEPIEVDEENFDFSGEVEDEIAGYGLFIQDVLFTEDGGGFSGTAGDFALDFTNVTAPNAPDITLQPLATVDGFSALGNEFLAAVNSSTGDNRLVVSFWQSNFTIPDVSSTFVFSTTFTGTARRGLNAHNPLGSGQIIFDHVVGDEAGARARLGGATPTIPDVDGVPFDFTPFRHYLYVKDGDTKEVFIDGDLVLSGAGGGFTTTLQALFVGSDAGGGSPISGVIDDFAIFNLKPSDAQIAALAAGVSPIDVLNAVAAPDNFLISAISLDGSTLTLTFNSTEGVTYAITSSLDLTDFDGDAPLMTGIPAAAGTETTVTIDLSGTGLVDEERVFFRVEEEEVVTQ